MPNPFYQVYAVAALAVGAEPVYVPHRGHRAICPITRRCRRTFSTGRPIAYICSPANPQGAVADEAYWAKLIALAERHDFQIFADECYSEIYRDTPRRPARWPRPRRMAPIPNGS
jgi:N-succinyldiaminopimelate aminotransferase